MMERALCLVVVDGYLPVPDRIVIPLQRLRGAILKKALRALRPDQSEVHWEDLDEKERQLLSELTGKNADGTLLEGRKHLVLLPWYGQNGEPDRIYLWKPSGLRDHELHAVMAAARQSVDSGAGRIALAPFGRLSLPDDWIGPATQWASITPFVPAASRHRYRSNGKPRAAESPDRQVALLATRLGLPEPRVLSCDHTGPTMVHRSRAQRDSGMADGCWPGHRLRLEFPEAVEGPLFLGHSGHFGLGLFQRA